MEELRWNKEFAMGQVDGDEELLQELLTIFKDSSASDMEALLQAVAGEDPVAARSAAHSIKGAAASLGLEAVRDVAMAIEKDSREGALDVARQELSNLQTLLALVQGL